MHIDCFDLLYLLFPSSPWSSNREFVYRPVQSSLVFCCPLLYCSQRSRYCTVQYVRNTRKTASCISTQGFDIEPWPIPTPRRERPKINQVSRPPSIEQNINQIFPPTNRTNNSKKKKEGESPHDRFIYSHWLGSRYPRADGCGGNKLGIGRKACLKAEFWTALRDNQSVLQNATNTIEYRNLA